jgi:hypothetical protein
MTRSALALGMLLALGYPAGVRAATTAEIKQCESACSLVDDICFDNCGESCCSFFRCGRDCLTSCYSTCLDQYGRCVSLCNGWGSGNVDPLAKAPRNGRRVMITGPITCPAGLNVLGLRVTVNQPGVGAIAEGQRGRLVNVVGRPAGPVPKQRGDRSVAMRCSGEEQRFALEATTVTSEALDVPGHAFACALALFGGDGIPTDAKQWCTEVSVIPEETVLEGE